MKRNYKKILVLLLIVSLTSNLLSPMYVTVSAATDTKFTYQDYLILLAKALSLKVDNQTDNDYINAAINAGLLKESEKDRLSKNISNQYVAVLTNRADEIMMGEKYSYDETLYYQIKNKKRISDISKASKGCKDSIYIIFSKGIMVGYYNGKYSQNRSFKPTGYITLTEAKTVIKRLIKKTSRKKISPDGQVIRTTNLPKNYKSFDYIINSIPNSFYEEKFVYQTTSWGAKPVNLKDYASPKNLKKMTVQNAYHTYMMSEILEKYQEKWCDKVLKNLTYRLNFNYKNVNEEWINGLRNTYPIYSDKSMNQDYENAIKQYVKIAKDNKVIIKSSKIIVEPSTLYYSDNLGFCIRCYVKVKITSASKFYTYKSKNQRLMIYGSQILLDGLKKNIWYEATFDVGLSGNSMTDNGSGYAVTTDWMYK